MNVYIAKHYWKNGKNATWECHNKIDKKLFEYLKENYSTFVDKRPTQIKQYRQSIYLCYEDTHDEHDRKITNITFFISKKEIMIDCFTHLDIKELEFKIKDKLVRKILSIFILIGLIGTIFFNYKKILLPFSNLINNDKKTIMKIKEYNYSNLINNWNEKYSDLKEEYSYIKGFKLNRDGENNSSIVIRQLNDFIKSFIEPKIIKPKDNEESKYNDFLFKYKNSNINFNITMEESEIIKKLKEITKEKTMNCVIKKVLMINNFNVWKNEHKKEDNQCLTK